MDLLEHQQAFLAAIQDGDWGTVDRYLADSFTFSGPVPEPVGKQAWLHMQKVYKAAFPDLNYNFEFLGIEGNQSRAANQMTGTHTGDLDLSAMGMGVIPATGNAFSMRRQEGVATWDGDKVVSVEIDATPEDGLPGILAQLGVQPPG